MMRAGIKQTPAGRPLRRAATQPDRLARLPQRWSPRTCQYIAGEPSADDGCKCGAAAPGRWAYCARHAALCVRLEAGGAPVTGHQGGTPHSTGNGREAQESWQADD